jgi:hypothetical protein
MEPTPPIPKLHWFGNVLVRLLFFLFVGFCFLVFRAHPLGELGHRSIESVHLGELMQARYRSGSNPPGGLLPEGLPDIYAYAAYLAQFGNATDVDLWFSKRDPVLWPKNLMPDAILLPNQNIPAAAIASHFQGAPLAWAVALLPDIANVPQTTPMIWTRGLQSDGTWRKDSPAGALGGHVGFVAGNAKFYHEINGQLFKFGTQQPTNNILEALPPGTRVSEYTPTSDDLLRSQHLVFINKVLSVASWLGALLLTVSCAAIATLFRNKTWRRVLCSIIGVVCSVWFWFSLAS